MSNKTQEEILDQEGREVFQRLALLFCRCTEAGGNGCRWCSPQFTIEHLMKDKDLLEDEVERLSSDHRQTAALLVQEASKHGETMAEVGDLKQELAELWKLVHCLVPSKEWEGGVSQ